MNLDAMRMQRRRRSIPFHSVPPGDREKSQPAFLADRAASLARVCRGDAERAA
jgi:hypothetical protein